MTTIYTITPDELNSAIMTYIANKAGVTFNEPSIYFDDTEGHDLGFREIGARVEDAS